MAQTPEKKVKKKITDLLNEMGVYHFSPYMSGMGRAGIPDIIACCHGAFVAIEAKAGDNKPTALQEREISRINTAHGHALVVNEDNLDELRLLLTKLLRRTK
jgi:Holliday junction resolvase